MNICSNAEERLCKPADIGYIDAGSYRVCFVCTGNTCRSPMAAAAYNYLTDPKKTRAVSCGLYPMPCSKISPEAVNALACAGIPHTQDNPYEGHCAVMATEELLLGCDMIVGMTAAHTIELISRFPHLAQRIFSMPRQISDPWGGDDVQYHRCLEEIIDGIKELFHIE